MEDADSDSGFDSDGDWYHAGRDIVYGLRTDSYAVGPRRTKSTQRESPFCVKRKGGTPPKRWDASLVVEGVSKLTHPLPVLVRLIGTQKGQG